MSSKQTVLITGAHGFIGRNAAKHFQENDYHVIGLGHGSWEKAEWKQWGLNAWFEGPVSMNYLMDCLSNPPDCIVHCAGSGSVGFSYDNPAQDFDSNVTSLLIVLEYIRKNSPSTVLVYPSSAAVYGRVYESPKPISEEVTPRPISPYGYHKKIAEDLCLSYRSNYSLNISVIRYFSVYGPGLKKQLLFDCCEKVRSDNPVFFGTGDETRDFLHVKDAVNLCYYVATCKQVHDTVFNGGTGVSITTGEIVERVFYYFNYNSKAIFNGKQRDGDPTHYRADITKSLKLGWKPDVAVGNGIREYANWYKRNYLC